MAAADYRRGGGKVSLRTFLSRWHWPPDTWRMQHARAGGPLRSRSIFAAVVLVAFACMVTTSGVAFASTATSSGVTALAARLAPPSPPNFGSNVYIFNPSMPQSQIPATVNSIANQQVPNHFSTHRYA